MRHVKKNQKKLMILSIALFIVCGITLGYAVLSSSLKINGMGTISTNWDILFTDITEKSSKGATSNESRITDKLTATFDVDLESPGSYIEYNVKIKNNGNIDAVIERITGIVEANKEAPTEIQFAVSGLRIGDDLLAGTEKTLIVKAELPRHITTLPSAQKLLNLQVSVRQKDIDSSGLVTTFKDCFQLNESRDTITGYLCGKNNTNGYSEILDVTIPKEIDGVIITKIGDYSFDSKKINSVIIPSTVTDIGNRSFSHNKLSLVNIPSSVRRIGYQSFMDNLLTEIIIPNGVYYIDMGAFNNNQMPDSGAFIYNRNSDGTENRASLNSYAGAKRNQVIIPEEITVITRYAFNGLGLQSVILPAHLRVVEENAFSNNKLSIVEFPNTLEELKDYAFSQNSLTQVALPSNLVLMGKETFRSNKLTNVIFQGNVPATLGNNIFSNNSDLKTNTIKVPTGTLEQYKSARGSVNNKVQSPSQTWFGSDDASLLNAFYE